MAVVLGVDSLSILFNHPSFQITDRSFPWTSGGLSLGSECKWKVPLEFRAGARGNPKGIIDWPLGGASNFEKHASSAGCSQAHRGPTEIACSAPPGSEKDTSPCVLLPFA